MIDKIVYDNGKIRSGFDTFKCDEDVDMERLCINVNSLLVEKAIEIQRMENQLMLIREVLSLNEED